MFYQVFLLSVVIASLYAQPKEGVEFRVNTITGFVIDSVSNKPVMDVNVDIYTGNGILKHSTVTDEFGSYKRPIVGYLWKPKIRFTLHNYYIKQFRLNPEDLDSLANMTVNALIIPVPENKRIPDLEESTITNRAETFFIEGNIFYNLINTMHAERIIIKEAQALETSPGFILMNVNGTHYDVARCYVPQEGRYENLSYIMKSLLSDSLFKKSGNPLFLEQKLLKPSIIYGSVIDISNGDQVTGAEIIISKPYKRRLSDENGKFAFQVSEPGSYFITMNPPPDYREIYFSKPEIKMKYGRGGWYKTNFYVTP